MKLMNMTQRQNFHAVVNDVSATLNSLLEAEDFQGIIGSIAFVIGLVMCIVPAELSFNYISIVVVGLLTGLALENMEAYYQNFGIVLQIIVSVEVSGLACFLMYVGLRKEDGGNGAGGGGLRKALGVVLGLFIAFYMHLLVQNKWGNHVANHWLFLLFCFNVSVLIGLWGFSDFMTGHHYVLGFVFAFFGSILTASALYFFLFLLVQALDSGDIDGRQIPAGPPDTVYVKYFEQLCWVRSDMVGIFANTTLGTQPFLGEVWGLDRILSRVLWVLLLCVASFLQYRTAKKAAKQEKAELTKAKSKAGMGESKGSPAQRPSPRRPP
jgi:hypothetical protein